jgi:hypothetical protein
MKKKFNLLLKQILYLSVLSYFSLSWGTQKTIAVLPKQIQAYPESKVENIQGTLEIRSVVSLKSSGEFTQYLLKTDQEVYYHIHFMDGIPRHLKTGDKIKIHNSYLLGADKAYNHLVVSKNDLLVLMPATTKLPDAFGPQPTIVFLVNFLDDQVQPFTIDQVKSAFFINVSNQFNEFSYQQTTLTGTVVGWYTIPISSKSICSAITYDLPTLAQNAAVAAGVNVSPYIHQVYLFPHTDSCDWKGQATIGRWRGYSQAWLNEDISIGLIAHLLGHNIGLFHSHSLECQGTVNTGTCNQVEQGDSADTMGFLNGAHFNALQKEIIGWLNYSSFPLIKTVTTSGTYLIAPFETMGNNIKALKVLKRAGTNDYYYLEYRQPIGYDSVLDCSNCNITKGVLVHQGNPSDRDSSEMLNMSPISNNNTLVTLLPGESFFDPYAPNEGVIFTVNWVGSEGASVTITFRSG